MYNHHLINGFSYYASTHLNSSLHYIQKNVFTWLFQDHILCITSGNLFKGPILESFRNKLSYAIDVETINFYNPFQFEVLPYCLIISNLSCISETLDLYISKHVLNLFCKQIWTLLFIICQYYYIVSLSISFPFLSWWNPLMLSSSNVKSCMLGYAICQPTLSLIICTVIRFTIIQISTSVWFCF